MTEFVPIDVAVVAARIRKDGRRARVSTFELTALALFVEQQLTSPVPASLAASIALAIAAHGELEAVEAGHFAAAMAGQLPEEADLALSGGLQPA